MADEHSASEPEKLREYLECWRLPGGVLARDQMRDLVAWDGTPEEDREALQRDLAAAEQQVPPKALAPNQRRGHNSWLDRVKGLFRR